MPDTSMSIRDRQACFGPDPEADELELQSKSPDEPTTSGDHTSSAPHRTELTLEELRSLGPDAAPDFDPEAIKAMAQSDPDYKTLSVSATFPLLATVGVSASYTIDRFGHSYFGLSMGAGVGVATPVTLGESRGTLVHDQPDGTTSEEQPRNFLCGDSVGARGGVVAGVGVTNSAGGTAIETSFSTAAEIGVGFGHNWGQGCP